jgi:hypothetical protein
VLAVGHVAGLRNQDGWFSAGNVRSLLEALRVPAPANVDRDLQELAKRGDVVRRGSRPPWSLAPAGRERIGVLVGELDTGSLAAELAAVPGAELGHVLHTLIPPSLAPVAWVAGIERMLRESPFERNVFCMTRFPEDETDTEYLDPVKPIIPALRQALADHRLTMHLASDRQLADDLYGNIAAHMWACQFGIGLFEDRLGRGLNENMLIEVGSMIVIGRRCALLKDKPIERMPTDFVGQIYKEVDFADIAGVSETVHRWAARDLGLGRCAACPPDPPI